LLTPTVLEVKTFGGFSISRNIDKDLVKISEQDNLSRKLWALIEYLILFRKRGVTKTELIDAFWGDDGCGDPENNLKALVFRARRAMAELGLSSGKDVIICHNNCYRLNESLSFRVDAEQFEALFDAADKANALDERLKYSLAAINLYKGDFLIKSLDFSWASALNIYYHAKYLKLCTKTILLLAQAKRHEEIINLCKKALTIEPYDEHLHRSLIEAFVSTGATQAAMRHYTYVIDLFITELAVSPSKELTALYHKIASAVSEEEQDIFSVRNGLQECDEDTMPFFCGYATFKDIYRLEARSAGRSGEAVQLVMLSLSATNTKALSSGQIRSGMEYLMQAIIKTLRISDVVCQFSSVQYLILLPDASFENGQKVVERVLQCFHTQHPKVSYTVNRTLLNVLPRHNKNGQLIREQKATVL